MKKCKINVSKLNSLIHGFEFRTNKKEPPPPSMILFTKSLRNRQIIFTREILDMYTYIQV